jgi:dTDP-4-amino-4,6-dideoxygalactose transaminase
MIREYGWENRISHLPGRNSRLDEVQAAVLNVKLKYLDKDNEIRSKIAKKYFEAFNELPLTLPKIRPNAQHVFHQFVIQVENRKDFISYLNDKGIFPGIHYPIPIHSQPAYKNRISVGEIMTVSERLSKNIVSLPVYPELLKSEINEIIDAILSYFKR